MIIFVIRYFYSTLFIKYVMGLNIINNVHQPSPRRIRGDILKEHWFIDPTGLIQLIKYLYFYGTNDLYVW